MLLYVNGDSHSAGAEAIVPYCFAEDDSKYFSLGRVPHPINLEASYGNLLAKKLNFEFYCDAESASSNIRILRTTKEFLKKNKPDLIVIGWSTWEREEWLHDDIYYQVNSSGADFLPKELELKYKEFVLNVNWPLAKKTNHQLIYSFHLELQELQIPHLFFNCYSDFFGEPELDWNDCYIDPYDTEMTYWKWLKNNGFKSNNWYHYKADGHAKWAEFLLPHLTRLL